MDHQRERLFRYEPTISLSPPAAVELQRSDRYAALADIGSLSILNLNFAATANASIYDELYLSPERSRMAALAE